jgi:hypothetical protein
MGEIIQFPGAPKRATRAKRSRVNERSSRQVQLCWRVCNAAMKASRRQRAKDARLDVEEVGIHAMNIQSDSLRSQLRTVLRVIATTGVNPVARRTAINLLAAS